MAGALKMIKKIISAIRKEFLSDERQWDTPSRPVIPTPKQEPPLPTASESHPKYLYQVTPHFRGEIQLYNDPDKNTFIKFFSVETESWPFPDCNYYYRQVKIQEDGSITLCSRAYKGSDIKILLDRVQKFS